MRCTMKRMTAALIAVGGFVGLISTSTSALPPGTAPSGVVTMSPSSGVATSEITLAPPTGAACQGDSATGDYRWQTFIASASVDVGTLTYSGGAGPNPVAGAVVQPLLSAAGSTPVVDQTTSVNSALLIGIPTINFAAFPAGFFPAGNYKIGFACTLANATTRYWVASITVTNPGGAFTFVNDTTAPTITARTPAANATAVALGVNATATFSEAMNATTVTGTSVTLRLGTATTGALIAAAVSYNATTRVVTLNPTSNLAADTRYTVRLGTGNKDAAGNALVATSWTFLTGPAPTITARTPAANATGVSRTQNQTATFSETMTAAKMTTTNVTLRVGTTATGALIGSVVSYNATTRVVTLNPNATLAANTVYTVRLAGLTDVAGNPLPATLWSFTTGA
jgi:Bacterial Ig-like domain